MPNNEYCESCMMPFKKDTGTRESDKYCSLCYTNGKLNYQGDDLKEFQKIVYDSMVQRGSSKLFAKFATFMIRFAPRWKK